MTVSGQMPEIRKSMAESMSVELPERFATASPSELVADTRDQGRIHDVIFPFDAKQWIEAFGGRTELRRGHQRGDQPGCESGQ